MATYLATPAFKAQFKRLTPAERKQFTDAVAILVDDLNSGDGRFTPRLRVAKMNRSAVDWEMTWAPDGRAIFRREPSPLGEGHQHIVWIAIGSHSELFSNRRAQARN